MAKVVVIGAGVGGMAVANIMAKQGHEVHVYETHATPGGRMGVYETQGFRFDTGPSWYLMPEVFEHYFALFGKKPSDYYELIRLNPGYSVGFNYAEPITITSDLDIDAQTFAAIEPGSDEKLQAYVAQAEKTYMLALKYFLYNPFRSFRWAFSADIIRNLPLLLTQLLRPLHGFVQRHVKTQQLQQILEYPMVFLGASPWNAPAMYQLMSYLDFKQGVYYPQKGMYEVAKALHALGGELGVTYHFNQEVTEIVTDGHVATGVRVGGKFIAADIVISNSDLHFTETALLSPEVQSYPERYWQRRVAGPSAVLLYLGVKGSLPQLQHHSLFFVKDWRQNFDDIYADKQWPNTPSIYVCKPSATDATVAPKGHENVFVLVPLPSGVSVDDDTVHEYVDRWLVQLEHMSGINDLRERIVCKEIRTPHYFEHDFHAWQSTALGMSHTLRQSAFLRPNVRSKKVKNLYYVGGGTQPGIGVPMCLISAELVYKAIIGDASAGPLPSLGSAQ